MDQFETISYEQTLNLLRRHANDEVTLITSPFPGMSFQITGSLLVQEGEVFAFSVMADERLNVSVMPFPACVFQIPKAEGEVSLVVGAMPGEEPGAEIMMWMVRFD